MKNSEPLRWTRRGFMGAVSAAVAGGAMAGGATVEGQAPRTVAKAVAGDSKEPKWESQLSVTVGPEKADLIGSNEKVIQAAVDYIAAWGGGSVHVLPGTYLLRNAVAMRSGVRIVGSGLDSVLIKEPEVKSKLTEDSVFWQSHVVLADPRGFQVGDGVCLQVTNERHRGTYVERRTLVARDGNRFKLDRPLLHDDFDVRGNATVATLFPLFSGINVSDACVENITLDGNKAKQEHLFHNWGNYLAGIWLSGSNRIHIRNVMSRNSSADGISNQTCHDLLIEECHCHDNVGFGIHSGSGSQGPVARNNKLENNYVGYYFCWGVQHALMENNVISESRRYGIRLGQKDTDNLIRGNEIRRSGEAGVILVDTGLGRQYSPDRNRIEDNKIVDVGAGNGIGIDVRAVADDITIAHNGIQETRQPLERVGVRIGRDAGNVKLVDNRVDGFAQNVVDLRGRRS